MCYLPTINSVFKTGEIFHQTTVSIEGYLLWQTIASQNVKCNS